MIKNDKYIYKLIIETDSKIIGKVDGTAVTIVSSEALNIYKNIPEYSEVREKLTLDCFKLDDKAKLVDFFSPCRRWFLTNELPFF